MKANRVEFPMDRSGAETPAEAQLAMCSMSPSPSSAVASPVHQGSSASSVSNLHIIQRVN